MAPEKTTQPIVLYTPRHRVEGLVTLLKGERLSDKLNITERKFEAVTLHVDAGYHLSIRIDYFRAMPG